MDQRHQRLDRVSTPTSRNTAWSRDIDESWCRPARPRVWAWSSWSPLAGGYLAGKYKPGNLQTDGTRSAEAGDRKAASSPTIMPTFFRTLPKPASDRPLAGRDGAALSDDQPAITSAIVGAQCPTARETLSAGGWRLPPGRWSG